jgi:hypothetical protein
MHWRKLGRVYIPDGSRAWARNHAMVPTPLDLGDGRVRIYFAATDTDMIGRIGFVEIDISDPTQILREAEEPVLDIGTPGAFDDNGVVPACVHRVGNQIWMFYIGFQLGVRVRYFMFTGLAISHDGGLSFKRYQDVPLLDRVTGESITRTAPFVMRENDIWRLWYIGGDHFVNVGGKAMPSYSIRYVESENGLNWREPSQEVLPINGDDEIGFGRPWILAGPDCYRMWYSIRTRSRGYQLGYAESPDGKAWTRLDHLIDLDISPSGWDSEMIGYSALFPLRAGLAMAYNGNDYGRTGFGLAVSETAC